MKDGTSLDYKVKYDEKNRELIELKAEYVETLACLRRETKSREEFEVKYKTVQAILDEEDTKRNYETDSLTEVEEEKQDNSESESEIENNDSSEEEDSFESYGNECGKYVRAPAKKAPSQHNSKIQKNKSGVRENSEIQVN